MHANSRLQIRCDRCGQAFSTVTALTKHKRFCTEPSSGKGAHHYSTGSNHSGGSLSSPNSLRSHHKSSSSVAESFQSANLFSNPTTAAYNPLYQPFLNLFDGANPNCFPNAASNYQQLLAEQLNKLTSGPNPLLNLQLSADPSKEDELRKSQPFSKSDDKVKDEPVESTKVSTAHYSGLC